MATSSSIAAPSPRDATQKTYRTGTHRAIAPDETLDRIRPFLAGMGITRVANVTGLDRIQVPVVMVCRPNARGLSVAQGKGLTLAAAEASGLMESIEAYHAERILRPLKLATYAEMRAAHRVVDPLALPRTANSVFHEGRRLLWIEGQELFSAEAIWLPYELVTGDYTLPFPAGSGCFPMTSNGLASGNHPLEAISHGICEVVERDATRLWDLRPERRWEDTRVDLGTVDDPACREVLDRIERADMEVFVWETTSELGICAFLAILGERRGQSLRPLGAAMGHGCHPDRAVALLRALTEAAQSRLTLIAGSRDDIDPSSYEYAGGVPIWQRGADNPGLRAAPQGDAEPRARRAMRSFAGCPNRTHDTLEEDVAWELAQLSAAGITSVVAVDLTHPEIGLPVVRIVIPGLEGPPHIPDLLPGARAERLLSVDG